MKKFFYVVRVLKTGQWEKTGEQVMRNSFNIHSYMYSQPSHLNKLEKQSSCFFTHTHTHTHRPFQVSKKLHTVKAEESFYSHPSDDIIYIMYDKQYALFSAQDQLTTSIPLLPAIQFKEILLLSTIVAACSYV